MGLIQKAALLGLWGGTALLVFGMVACLAGAIGQWLGRTPQAQRVLHAVAALVFIALALRLLVAEI